MVKLVVREKKVKKVRFIKDSKIKSSNSKNHKPTERIVNFGAMSRAASRA